MLYLCLLIREDCNLLLQSQFSWILILQRVNEVREGWRHKVSAAGQGTHRFQREKHFFVLFCLLLEAKTSAWRPQNCRSLQLSPDKSSCNLAHVGIKGLGLMDSAQCYDYSEVFWRSKRRSQLIWEDVRAVLQRCFLLSRTSYLEIVQLSEVAYPLFFYLWL